MDKDLSQAKKLIAVCKETQDPYLDLGNCGIEDLNDLPELFECTHLETLILSNEWWDYDENEWVSSRNEGRKNKVRIISEKIGQLGKLKKLFIGKKYDYEKHLSDSYFIEKIGGLQYIDLRGNHLSDLNFTVRMPNLQYLNLSENQLSDLSFNVGMPNLQYLDLSENQLSDLSFNVGMPNLQYLDLNRNRLKNVKFAEELPSLQHLDISNNKLIDLKFLKDVRSLQYLDLSENYLSDLSFTVGMPSLQYLDLNGNKLRNLSFTVEMPALQYLDISGNQLIHLIFIVEMPNLKYLHLSGNQLIQLVFTVEMPCLKHLDICGNKLINLIFTVEMPALQYLYLQGNQLIDLSYLVYASYLQHLDISHNKFSDLSFLEDVPYLQYLDLCENQLVDLNYLVYVPDLQFLYVQGNQLSELSFLVHVPGLKYLNLQGNQFREISFTAEMYSLQHLDLRGNQLSELSFKVDMPSLQRLELGGNHLSKLNFMADMPSLQKLDLHGHHLSKLSFTVDMSNLQKLDLSSNQLNELSFTVDLSNLKELTFSNNQLKYFPQNILSFTNLYELHCNDNPFIDIPIELTNQDNCLQGVKHFYTALKKGELLNDEVKLVLIGNGRVGKTCLLRRLIYDDFDKNMESTHGIQIERWKNESLKNFKTQHLETLDQLKVQVWDFGGQDIYHATHRLFLQSKALFILCWDLKTEKDALENQEEEGKNHPLAYWLSYVKTLGKGSKVLLVQTKTEQEGHGRSEVPGYEQLYKQYEEIILGTCHLDSAIDDEDLNQFGSLKSLIRKGFKQIQEVGQLLPKSWYLVRQQLNTMILDKEANTLSYSDYIFLCKKEGIIDSGEQNTLLGLVNDTGIIFYQKGLFNNQIILDQQWVIDAVYTLFRREKDGRKGVFYQLKKYKQGIFIIEDLQDDWKDYSEKEQELFISFMKSCEICFEISKYSSLFLEREFIAPSLLPAEKPSAVENCGSRGQDRYLVYHYPFLHWGLVQSFIVRTWQLSPKGKNSMWKYGIWLTIDDTNAILEADLAHNRILIHTNGTHPKKILDQIRRLFEDLNRDLASKETYSFDGEHFLPQIVLENNRSLEIITYKGHFFETKKYVSFLTIEEEKDISEVAQGKPIMKEKLKIFISYSSADRYLREIFTNRLSIYLKSTKNKFDSVWTDKELAVGDDWNDEIQEALEASNIGILLVSPMFLGSDYCTGDEMNNMLERRKSEGYLIVPVLLRECNFFNHEDLRKMQFVRTYKSEYDVTNLLEKDKLMPFDELADIDRPNERLLNKYFTKVANEIDRAVSKFLDS